MSQTEPVVTLDIAKEHGLLEEEYRKILEILGRVPTYTEIGIFSVMWSEHCSYKNSIAILKQLPREGKTLLAKAGEENAGLIDIGGGLAVAFKIESHNHPSAVEPYQGAATGVGGIHRDIFTMGARPIASLNSLRFGNPEDPRVRYLVDGVVRGIGNYGNSFGVPTVAGDVYFEKCYTGNPLVNAMSVGLIEHDGLVRAIATGEGNPVLIVGSSTGRDGIHGATFASEELSEESESKRPSVQVGDPFAEKLLLEATLEAIKTGHLVGLQDMGAAGITSSTSEMSARGIEQFGKGGIEIDLDLAPAREKGMTAYELMLSESQERMLVVVKKGYEEEIIKVYEKWGVGAVVFGRVTSDNMLRVRYHGKVVAEIPAQSLVLGGGAPVYHREAVEKKPVTKFPEVKADKEIDFQSAILKLFGQPNIASKRWVYEQYDSMVRTNSATETGSTDAAVIRIKGTKKALSMKTDCNARYVYLNPRKGGMIAVAECARNLICTGAKPLGVTNCLNYGNPYKPDVYYQFRESVLGMGDACRKFDTPVTGGNVSFYNESDMGSGPTAIYPTPMIGMLGLINDIDTMLTASFKNDGDVIVLLGGTGKLGLEGSEYLKTVYGDIGTDAPDFDLDLEKRLHDLVLNLAGKKLLRSAHDISDGGLVTCLLESAILNETAQRGFSVNLEARESAYGIQEMLFSESQSRIVVSLREANLKEVQKLGAAANVPVQTLGTVGGETASLFVNGKAVFNAGLPMLSETYFHAVENALHLE